MHSVQGILLLAYLFIYTVLQRQWRVSITTESLTTSIYTRPTCTYGTRVNSFNGRWCLRPLVHITFITCCPDNIGFLCPINEECSNQYTHVWALFHDYVSTIP